MNPNYHFLVRKNDSVRACLGPLTYIRQKADVPTLYNFKYFIINMQILVCTRK